LISDFFARLTHPARQLPTRPDTAEDLAAFIDSRALEYATKLEDDFAERVRRLGVESGMVLDVGTRVGLIALKVLWQNENFFSIGVDSSSAMIDRARETATAWGLSERAFFQVGDAPVLSEIGRMLKPNGALLIRDIRRPNRFRMSKLLDEQTRHYGNRMRPQIEAAMHAAYTMKEMQQILRASSLTGARLVEMDEYHLGIEREGTTDPNSWISAREQYR
jgi:ubiquinone/menaquinone biosynthesis C-methylase UbiE